MSNNGMNNNFNDYSGRPPFFGDNGAPTGDFQQGPVQQGPVFVPGSGTVPRSQIAAYPQAAGFQGTGTRADGFAAMPQAGGAGFVGGPAVALGHSVFSGFRNPLVNPAPVAWQPPVPHRQQQNVQSEQQQSLLYGPQQGPPNASFQTFNHQGALMGQGVQSGQSQPNTWYPGNGRSQQGSAVPLNREAVPMTGASHFGQGFMGSSVQPRIQQPYGGHTGATHPSPGMPYFAPTQQFNTNNTESLLFGTNTGTNGPGINQVAYGTITGHPDYTRYQPMIPPTSTVQMLPRSSSQGSHPSHHSLQDSTLCSALLPQRQQSQASHHSRTSQRSAASAPSSATVAYPAHAFPPFAPMTAMPHQRVVPMLTPPGMQPSVNTGYPRTSTVEPPHPAMGQDERDALLGVGLQSNADANSSSQGGHNISTLSQDPVDNDVVLHEPSYSEREFKHLVRVNSQFTPPRILTNIETKQPSRENRRNPQVVVNYSPPLPSSARPQLQSAVTATSETSFGLESSSPLSSISATQGNSSYNKVHSAPSSAVGDPIMRNAKVPGVPVSMLNNFGVTDTSHHHDTAESSRDMKRRHSDDVTAAAKLAKKTPRSEKKEKGKRCFPCANSNRECDNSSPCQRCGKDNSTHYPVCISPDFSDHNIFVEGLSPELKTRAMDIIATDTEMSIDESSMAHIFRVLAEYKTGYPSFYDPFLMHGPKTAKFFVTPFHQASLMLQSYDFLESRSKDPHYAHLSLESENNLRLWRAVKATSALKFITAMMDKNRMPRETPKLSYHARYLVVNLAIIFEQTEAYEKTMAAGTTMSEALKEQHRHLLYHLAYRLRRMSDHAFRPESQLSKSVIIKKDMVRLDKGFWDKLEELWTTPAAEDEEALACSATTAPATCLSAVTPIDMDFSTTAAMGHVFSATQPSSTLMPPAMQRLGSRSSHIRKKAPQKPKKERERREDDKWDDERDGLDANTMVAVRCPIRDSVEEFVDLINRMHIHDPIPVSAPDDDGTVFLTGGMDANNMWTTDVGSPIDFLGDIYTANDDYQTNDVDMRRHDSAVEAENEASNSQAPDIRSGGVDALGSMSDLDGMVGRGIDRVDSLDYEKYLAASLQQAQAEDNANPNYNYNRLSAGPSPSTLQLPATSCPTSPLPGSSSILSTSRPATAASASSANSGNVSAARRAAQARPSGPPSRTRSVIDKGKGVMKNIFRY